MEFDMYGLVEIAGKQFKIENGDTLRVPFLGNEVGDKVTIDKVLLLNDGDDNTIGKPFVDGAVFTAETVSHGRERKIIVFKFKRRKGYQRKQGHRQRYTVLKVTDFSKN